MTRRLLLMLAACLLAGCSPSGSSTTIAIVGATLLSPGSDLIPYSVVIVRDGRLAALGSQQATPVPAGSEKVNGLGKFLVSAPPGTALTIGAAPNFDLLSADPRLDSGNYNKVEKRMRAGKWVTL